MGLDWDAPQADAESITGYRILRSSSPEIVLEDNTKSDVTEFIDDTVYDHGLYTYRIEGLRGNVRSDSSNSRTILFVDNELVAAPQVSEPERLLVKNTDPRTGNSAILTQANDKIAQVFTTGTHEGGYRITSISAVADTISNTSTAGDELTATINQGGSTNPRAVLCTLVNPTFTSSGLQTFTAPADCPTLNPRTTYFFVIERTSGTDQMTWESNEHNGEDPGGPGDWSIADGRRHLFGGSWSGDDSSHLIEIRGSLQPPALVKNTSLSGAVTLGISANGKIAQAFTTGAHTAGYRLTSIGAVSVQIADTATAGSELTATLNAASGANPDAILCTLTDPPAFTSNGVQTFTAPADCPTLRAKRTYFLLIERTSGTTNVLWYANGDDAEDPGRERDWKIANGYIALDPGAVNWTESTHSLLTEVRGAKVPWDIQAKNTGQPKVVEPLPYSLSSGGKAAQGFRTGKDEYGYTLASIAFTFTGVAEFHAATKDVTATLHTRHTNLLPGQLLCTLNNPTWLEADHPSTFTALADCPTLQPETPYFFVIERTATQPEQSGYMARPHRMKTSPTPGGIYSATQLGLTARPGAKWLISCTWSRSGQRQLPGHPTLVVG